MEPTWYYVWIWLVQNQQAHGVMAGDHENHIKHYIHMGMGVNQQGDVRCQGQRSVSLWFRKQERNSERPSHSSWRPWRQIASGVWIQRWVPNSWISPLKIEQSSGTSTWLLSTLPLKLIAISIAFLLHKTLFYNLQILPIWCHIISQITSTPESSSIPESASLFRDTKIYVCQTN